MSLFATNIIQNAAVYLKGGCTKCVEEPVKADEVEYCIASGFIRIKEADSKREWITHISNATILTEGTE